MGIGSNEEYFPRGGGKWIPETSEKKVQHRKRLLKPVQEPLEESGNESDSKLDFQVDNEVKLNERFFDLKYSDLREDFICLCAVRHVYKDSVQVSLPSNLFASIEKNDFCQSFNRQLIENNIDGNLSQYVHVGQVLKCSVKRIVKSSNFHRVFVTSNPASVNRTIPHAVVHRGFVLQASIDCYEDHGYSMASGIPGLTVFLPFENADYFHQKFGVDKLAIGTLLWVKVCKVSSSSAGSMVHVSAVPALLSKPLTDEQITPELYPGSVVKVVISQIRGAGAQVRVNASSIDGAIEWCHLFPGGNPKKYAIGDCLLATVLYRFPLTNKYFFSAVTSIISVCAEECSMPVLQLLQNARFPDAAIIKRSYNGVFVKLDCGDSSNTKGISNVKGFVPYSALGKPDRTTYMNNEAYAVGAKLDCKVHGVDHLSRIYYCHLDNGKDSGEYINMEDIQIGSVLKVIIEKHCDTGIKVKLGKMLHGFVPKDQIMDSVLPSDPSILERKLPINSEHKARVIKAKDGMLLFTLRQSVLSNKDISSYTDFKPGEKYYAKICSVHENFVHVKVNEKFTGILKVSDSSSAMVVNQIVLCYVAKASKYKVEFSSQKITIAKPGDLIEVTIKKDSNKKKGNPSEKYIVKGIDGFTGILNSNHIDNDTVLSEDSSYIVKVLKGMGQDKPAVVTMKQLLVNNHVPLDLSSCSRGDKVCGCVTSISACGGVAVVSFLEDLRGVVYMTPSKPKLTLYEAVCLYVIDFEKNCLVLSKKWKDEYKYLYIGSKHSLTICSVSSESGISASLTLPGSITKEVFLHSLELDDFGDLAVEKLSLLSKGDVIENAMLMSFDGKTPIFTLKNSIIKFLEDNPFIGRTNFDKSLIHLFKKSQTENPVKYIPCSIKKFDGDRILMYAPVRNIGTFELNINKNIIKKKLLKLHETILAEVNIYFSKINTLQLNMIIDLPNEIKKDWARNQMTYYLNWSRGSFTFGSKVNFYTENDTRFGSLKSDSGTSGAAYMLGDRKIQKYQTVQSILIHQEYKSGTPLSYVIPWKKSLIRKNCDGKSYSEDYLLKEVKVSVLYRNDSIELSSIIEPDEMKGLIVYLPSKMVNQVVPLMSDQYLTIFSALIIGCGQGFFIGIKPQSMNITDSLAKLEISKRSSKRLTSESSADESVSKRFKPSIQFEAVKTGTEVSTKENKKRKVSSGSEEKLTDKKAKLPDQFDMKDVLSSKKVPNFLEKQLQDLAKYEKEMNDEFLWDPTPQDLARVVNDYDATQLSVPQKDEDTDDSDGDEGGGKRSGPLSKKEKRRKQLDKEKKVREKEEELMLATDDPQSSEHFERVVLARPNDSKTWIKYMAFHLQATEIDKARSVAKRALNIIQIKEEQERLNVWMALLNMEYYYSTKEEFRDVLSEALRCNDDFKVNMRVLEIYSESKNTYELEHLTTKILKKYKENPECWYGCLSAMMKSGMEERARTVLQRALKSLPTTQHITLICRFALLENSLGHSEQAQTLFDNVLTSYPQRVDIWFVYIDMLVKSDLIDLARQIFERAVNQKLTSKKMKSVYSKWLAFEEKHGNKKSIENVKKSAAEFVSNFTIALNS